jgi:2-(1,2-epoxy-1,2-dihydrophenyl)acetyl-CoA isomerase
VAERRPIIEAMRYIGDIMLRLHRLPKPTLAKVDGVAVGVGLGVALACDLVVASDRARFSEIFSKRGLALDGGNSWILPRMIGLQKAKELAFFGDMVSADEAERIGLINKVVPVEQLDAVAGEWARRLAGGPTVALSLSKRLLNASFGSSYDEALEDEGRCQHLLFTTHDMQEAMMAYHERREPRFAGS